MSFLGSNNKKCTKRRRTGPLEGGSFLLSRIVSGCVKYSWDDATVRRFRTFFAEHASDVDSMEKTLNQAFEYAETRIEYAKSCNIK